MEERFRTLVVGLAATLVCSGTFGQTTYPFAVTIEKEPGGHRIVARNDGPAPVSVRVSLPMTVNVTSDRPFPLFTVVPPNGGTLYLGRVFPVLSGASSSFKTEHTWALGDFNARSDGSLYRLPYPDGYAFRIGQAPAGPITTHTEPDSRFAVDITMPEGTPVVAARGGVVIKAKADQTRGGKDPSFKTEANEVQILHPDGSMAVYAHLAPGGVRAYPGQRVTTGTLIGLSGSTGYSSGPHLHMAVQRLVRTNAGFMVESIPFQFYVGVPAIPFQPTFGQLVRADYTATGSAPLATGQEPTTAEVAARRAPTHRPPLAQGPDAMVVSLQVPAAIMATFQSIEPWQWLAGMVAVVVTALLASNFRQAQRRRAWTEYQRSEPRIGK